MVPVVIAGGVYDDDPKNATLWGAPTTVTGSAFDEYAPLTAVICTSPTVLPVIDTVASPLETGTVDKPVTAPIPPVWINVTGEAYVVSTLDQPSATVPVTEHDVFQTKLVGQVVVKMIWLTGPGPVGVMFALFA